MLAVNFKIQTKWFFSYSSSDNNTHFTTITLHAYSTTTTAHWTSLLLRSKNGLNETACLSFFLIATFITIVIIPTTKKIQDEDDHYHHHRFAYKSNIHNTHTYIIIIIMHTYIVYQYTHFLLRPQQNLATWLETHIILSLLLTLHWILYCHYKKNSSWLSLLGLHGSSCIFHTYHYSYKNKWFWIDIPSYRHHQLYQWHYYLFKGSSMYYGLQKYNLFCWKHFNQIIKF